eukprot:4007919-Alexandrium_andersonii.AAC.1
MSASLVGSEMCIRDRICGGACTNKRDHACATAYQQARTRTSAHQHSHHARLRITHNMNSTPDNDPQKPAL